MSVPIPIVNSVFQPIVTEALGPTKDHIRYTVYCTKHVRDMRRNIDKLNVAKDDVESHKNRNEKEGREIPSNVVVWLEKVKRINGLVEKMPIDIGCFCNFYTRHKIGREAFKIYEEINYILEWNDQMKWTDNLIPPGRIPSTNASISSTPFTDPQASTSSAPSSNHQASTSSLPSIIHRLIKKNKKKSSNHQASTISTPSTNHQSSTSSAPSSNHQASTSSAPSTHHQASTSCAPSSNHQASTSSAPSIDHQASTISAPSSNHQASTSYAPSTDHQASTSCAPSSNHQASTSSAPSIDHQASTSSAPSTDHQASTSSTPSSNHQASTSSAPSTDHQASTSSTPSTDHRDEFPSRKHIISEALKALESNRETHMVALCGMGGVGKTKMIQRLKKIVIEQKMFDWLVEVDIGPKTDIVAIQSVVAYYLGVEIKDTVQEARIDTLRKWFKANSGGGETKFLIILDDVWERLNLNDIGLSPLPNQGVNFKVLLTSQDRNICNVMRVEANLTLTVNVLTEEEAKGLFSRAIGNFDDVDWELKKIGEDIVKKCSGLPSAIEKMAVDLKNKGIDTWKDTLSRLEVHDVEKFEPTGFKRSLNSLAKETLSIFLLCGLFSTFIPTEELLRYGCGLKLFERVCTIKNARIRLSSKIEELKHKFLLIESDDVSCIKMHDLMLSVVLNMVSKGEHASFVRYGSIGEWPEDDMSIYKRIISTCEGMTGFPEDLTFPNLSMLKLMQGDDSLRFPSYFYKEMKELKVIAYDNMKHYPAIRGCSINLRVLHLHQCSLDAHDFSSIGNLYNLEVLSFAKSKIQCLPSIIGKLKKLMLLDLTDCSDLRIDEGVLRSLGKLEELYAIAGSEGRNALRFTNDNLNEMAKRSKELSALEFEFIGSNILPENISFENLQRFKISVGRSLDGGFSKSKHSYENTLQLVSNMADMANYKMNELFKKTKVLCLSVEDMNDLENIEVNSAHLLRYSSFRNLRVLVVSECEKLKYLFTLRIAKDLSQLEHLEVDECNDMEELIRTNGSGATITFPRLKSLSLRGLSKLSSLHRDLNTIELPRLVKLQLSALPKITNIYPVSNLETSCLLKKEIVVPKLEELQIEHLDNLKEIWPCDFTDKVTLRVIHVDNCDKLVNLFPCNLMLVLNHLEEIQVTHCRAIKVLINNDRVGEVREEDNLLSLRRIQVKHCDNLVNLFPDNPMSLLHHLEDLHVENCSSIELLFNIDLDCGSQIGEGCNNSSLSILVKELGKLREVWRIKGESNSSLPIRVKTITINECTDFRNVVTPTSINFNLGTPEISIISNSGESGRQ